MRWAEQLAERLEAEDEAAEGGEAPDEETGDRPD